MCVPAFFFSTVRHDRDDAAIIETLLVAVPTLPAIAALAIALVRPPGERSSSWAVQATAAAFAAAIVVAVVVGIDGPIAAVVEAADGDALVGLYATRVTAVLGLLTTGVGLVVHSFSGRALRGDLRERRFFVLTSLLTAATTSVVFAATLGFLCASWIVAGLALAALVAHRADWPPARRAGRRTRRSLWVGDVSLLVATVLTVVSVGEIDLRSSAAAAEELSNASLPVLDWTLLSVVAVVLTVAGISRSALVPLHRWLPSTVAAPTPVSAMLHAGVVNGAGVLLVRVAPVFGSSAAATHLAFAAGAVTALYATTVMLVRSDVKGSLAWSTAGQMGFMTVQVAVGAFAAALLHIVGHGMYKAALFLGSGGAVRAHLRHRQRPATLPVARTVRLGTALLVPAAALRAAYVVIDPHLSTAADMFVTVFAWATAARAADGWLRSAPFPPVPAVATAVLGSVAGVFAYIGGLNAFETFVAPALPAEVAEPVTSTLLAATLAAIALVVAAVWLTPGDRMRRFRSRMYLLVLTSATPRRARIRRMVSARGSSSGIAPVPAPPPPSAKCRPGPTDTTIDMTNGSDRQRRSEPHTDLLVDVSRAADIIAPLWPLTTFVAVNPLGGLQHLSFDDATAVARRWLGARTHRTLAEFREAHARGAITDADLRRAIVEVDWKLISQLSFQISERTVDMAEIVRLDLLVGPEEEPETAPPVGSTDAGTVRAVDELVAAWCAAYVDEAGVPWPMPGREHGFFRAWRELAPHDRRLRGLAGPAGVQWLAQLPDRPTEALAASLDALGVHDGDRVDALREHLGRLPGWAGYAHWHDEWAPPEHHRDRFRLVDLLAVQVAATAAAAHGAAALQPRQHESHPVDKPPEQRAVAVLAALGSTSDDPLVTSAVRGVLQQVLPAVRSSMWLQAQEGNFRDRLLGLLTRLDPGPVTERPDVQAVFCIDVRSEGLRRHLEACGPYETFGFAGFFGVPVRWRPLGSTASQPRCPVLVTPRHEVAEQPLVAHEALRHLAAQRIAGSGHEAFHAAKGSVGGPFALAEAAGYVMGPMAAGRTLAPRLARRVSRLIRRRAASLRTRPAVEGEHDDSSGLAPEERSLFAEAIVRTMGLSRFASLIVLCGHGSHNVNNPHASSYDCGACGGTPGGPSARVAAAILNDPAVRAALVERGITVPDDTYFVAAQHDTVSDEVTVLDRDAVPAGHEGLVAAFEWDVSEAGGRLARERARRLPGDPARVRVRGHDWAQVRPEWGLAGNAAFVVGPRSITAGLDLACRVFLHSYDADADHDGTALETILTAPLVVAQWISAQYYFSAVDPDVFGAGDKMLHNPVGGIGVVLGEGGDLQVGLPAQAVAVGEERMHEPLRLLAIVQAPLTRIEAIIERNDVLQELIGGKWITVAGRSHGDEHWSIRSPAGTWVNWYPADASVDHTNASLGVR